ncbi:MAG TPA: SUMF1/EgtB/PvdO family nonheme iron enzyme [Thermoanaerobaculia bacterium]|nr:SUMF1/EgtB/PvdO family nonheme iron enzyme [Thermoanaerobaculia bacterium]
MMNLPAIVEPPFDSRGWLKATFEARRELAKQAAAQMDKDFEPLPFEPREELLPTFLHRKTGIPFKLVAGGAFRMGLSEEEEQRARQICDPIPATLEEMRPVHERRVQTALVSVTPVLWRHFGEWRRNPTEASDGPRFVTRSEALSFAETLGCRLPSETEWEYACRAGNQSLFTWGDDLPSDEELEGWLSWDLSDLEQVRTNRFGLAGLFFEEWCADPFAVSYEQDAPIEPDSFTIRGGGAFFWPWQDEEWVWCMSAMRMPSTGLLDGTAAFRLVADLPANAEPPPDVS